MPEWERLTLGAGGILRCKTAVGTQLVLPGKYKDTAKEMRLDINERKEQPHW